MVLHNRPCCLVWVAPGRPIISHTTSPYCLLQVVEPKKAIVDADVAKAEAAAAAAKAIKTECEEALSEAIPILEAAISALDTIKPADIKLVQSFKNPPGAIKVVMEAVCVLLDAKPLRCV